jgi:hypothetical protein
VPSIYLQSSDYATYGLPSTTSQSEIIKASAIIDGYLNKPDGLLYDVDINNIPVVMSATGLPIKYKSKINLNLVNVLGYTPIVNVVSAYYSLNSGLPSFILWDSSKYSFSLEDFYSSGYAGLQIIVNYVAGWTYAGLPYQIKQACANIVLFLQNGIISGNVSGIRAGDTEIKLGISGNLSYYNAFVDPATASLLRSFRRNHY